MKASAPLRVLLQPPQRRGAVFAARHAERGRLVSGLTRHCDGLQACMPKLQRKALCRFSAFDAVHRKCDRRRWAPCALPGDTNVRLEKDLDGRIWALLLPAIAAVFLDPLMALTDTGISWLIADVAHLQLSCVAERSWQCLLREQCSGYAVIVGSLGTVPLGAVGLSNLIFFFCTVLFSFLLAVITPRVAQAKAQGQHEQV